MRLDPHEGLYEIFTENAALRTRLEEEKMVKEKMTKTCKDLKFFWDNGMIDWSNAPHILFLPE